MANNNIVIDAFLDPNSSNLKGIDASYVDYKYEQITSSMNASDWNYGRRSEFIFPQYENSVWQTDDYGIYIDAEATLDLIANTPGGTYNNNKQSSPLSALSTAAIEQFFVAGLIEDYEITWGGTPIKSIESPSNGMPYVQSLYIVSNDEQSPASKGGNAILPMVLTLAGNIIDNTTYGTAIKLLNGIKNVDIYNDTQNPFYMSLDKHRPDPEARSGIIDTQTNDKTYTKVNNYFNSSYIYRQIQANSTQITPLPAVADLPPANKIRMILKLVDPFLDSPYKKPANLPLRIAITRSREISYIINGSTLIFDDNYYFKVING